MNLSSRKTHRKSRAGCGRCKKRKIKCDELKPECSNCLKHSVQCDFLLAHSTRAIASPGGFSTPYTSNSLSNSPNPFSDTRTSNRDISALQHGTRPPNLNILDLELLHNFATSTAYTLHNETVLKTLWRITVPEIGFSYDFVMRGILALSALHLAYYRPERREHFTSQAMLQNQAGLREATLILPHVTDENCTAVYIFTAMTCIFTLASPRKPGDFPIIAESGAAEWLVLLRGTRSIIESSYQTLKSGALGPMFLSGERRSRLRDEQANGSTTDEEQLAELRIAIRATSTNEQALLVYVKAIDELQKSFIVSYHQQSQSLEPSDLFIWLFRVSEEYLRFLQERTQESLAIFAYFCVIAKRLEKNWWSDGWSSHLMSRIYPLLDAEHRLWVRWPMEETGWLPTQDI